VATSVNPAVWVGGGERQTDPGNPACSVTVARPSGNVSSVMGDAWQFISQTGYSMCAGFGGEDGNGVRTPDCRELAPSTGSVENGRPVCSSAVCGSSPSCTGVARDTFVVVCFQ
jgi:hypothetical protein